MEWWMQIVVRALMMVSSTTSVLIPIAQPKYAMQNTPPPFLEMAVNLSKPMFCDIPRSKKGFIVSIIFI
jgi:hypothetical protein